MFAHTVTSFSRYRSRKYMIINSYMSNQKNEYLFFNRYLAGIFGKPALVALFGIPLVSNPLLTSASLVVH
jgi:hypothetical protein